MSLNELKREMEALSDQERSELFAFLWGLKHAADLQYRADVTRRLNDLDPSHWLSPDEFEKRLDAGRP